MIRRIMAVGLCLMLLSASTFAFAEDVYVTQNGSKYHKADCPFVKNRETETLSKEAALEEGFTPCSRCYKEDLAVSEQKTQQDTVAKK